MTKGVGVASGVALGAGEGVGVEAKEGWPAADAAIGG
jgi:hypothetical protein